MPELESPLPSTRPHRRAIRLTFSYEGEKIGLISQQQVEMIVPPSDPMHNEETLTGFWLDLKDAQGRTLFRRVLHQPIREDIEVFSPGPRQNISRKPVDVPKGIFVALLPDAERADHVTLTNASPAPGAVRNSVKELARFTLNK